MRKHSVAFDDAATPALLFSMLFANYSTEPRPVLHYDAHVHQYCNNTVVKITACHYTLHTQTLTCFTQSRNTYFVVVAVGCLQQAASKGSVAFQHAAAKNSVAYQHAAQFSGMPQCEACPCCPDTVFSPRSSTAWVAAQCVQCEYLFLDSECSLQKYTFMLDHVCIQINCY